MGFKPVLFVVLASVAAVPLAAQDFPVTYGTDFMSSMMNSVRTDTLLRVTDAKARERRETRERGTPPASRPKAARPTAPAAAFATGDYTPSPAVTTRVREQFARWIGTVAGEKGATEMRALMQREDILALWAKSSAVDGLKRNNFLDAMTAYYVQNWQVANDVETATPAQVQGVRRQLGSSLAENPQFTKLTAAQRQEMSEIFIYNQFVQGSAWINANNARDAAMKAKYAQAAVTRFRNEWGVDLRRQRLTDQGFVPRG